MAGEESIDLDSAGVYFLSVDEFEARHDPPTHAATTPAGKEDARPDAAAPLLRGSCLCGRIRFEVRGRLLRANHCHCSRCRKHSGTAVCTQARVRREHFRLLAGADWLKVYGRGEGAVKVFCGECGSSLFGGTWPDGPEISIRLGAFDDDPGIRPQVHTYVDDRAAWDEICDDLPRYSGAWTRDGPDR